MKECKLLIKDEVNVKLEGLELSDRKTLMKMFEFEKPGARYLPSVRLGRWNGKVSYCSLAGSTYINLLTDAVPILEEYDYDIELKNLKTIKKNLSRHENVKIPQVYDDYSSKNVLTMEYIPGIKITDIEDLDNAGIDRQKLISAKAQKFNSVIEKMKKENNFIMGKYHSGIWHVAIHASPLKSIVASKGFVLPPVFKIGLSCMSIKTF